MSVILADGVPDVSIKGDMVCVTFTSGGDVFSTAFTLADANAAVADYLSQLERRECREANLVAFPRHRHADSA